MQREGLRPWRLLSLRVGCRCLVAWCSPPVRRLQRIAADWLCGGRSVESRTSAGLVVAGAGSSVVYLPPRGSSGKLCTEVADVADETKVFVALRINRSDPVTRDLEQSRLTGLRVAIEQPVTRANQSEASVWVLGNVQRPGGVERDALPGVQVGKGRLALGEYLDAAHAFVLVDPLDSEDEACQVNLDGEVTRRLVGERGIDGFPLVGGRGRQGARCRRHQGREGDK